MCERRHIVNLQLKVKRKPDGVFLCVVIIVANLNETKGNIFLKKWITTKEKSESSCNIVNSFGSRALGTRRRIVFYPAKFYSDLFVFFF